LDWIAGNKELVEAISGIFVALFTGTLWWSTDKMWSAGERQLAYARRALRVEIASTKSSLAIAKQSADAASLSANAAIGVERASIHVESVTNNTWADIGTKDWIRYSVPTIMMKNYGRTPAFITEVNVVQIIGIITKPTYRNDITYQKMIVVPPMETTEYKEYGFYGEGTPSDELIEAFLQGKEALTIYGVIKFMDFMDQPHTRGFRFSWVPSNKYFIPIYHNANFHYQT